MLWVQVLLCLSVGDIHVTGMGDTVSLLVTSMLQLQVSRSSPSACDIMLQVQMLLCLSASDFHVLGTGVTYPSLRW